MDLNCILYVVEGRGERGGEREIEGYGRDMWEIWEGYENDMRWIRSGYEGDVLWEGYEIDMRWRYDKDVTGVWEWYDV